MTVARWSPRVSSPPGTLHNLARFGPGLRPAVVSVAARRGLPGRATKRDPRRGSRPEAFTLLEILLVLAIMGLIATVLIGGAAHLISDKPVAPDQVFWKAVQAARKLAVQTEHQVSLKFVADDTHQTKQFVVSDGQTVQTFPVPTSGNLEVSLLAPQGGGNQIIVGGTVLDTKPIPAAIFYPDGTCTAFRVQFYEHGQAHVLAIDPWTCAPVLTPPTDADGNPIPTPSS